jgi:hypothetical protein
VSAKSRRTLAWIALAVCVAGVGAGAWYIWGGGFDPKIEDASDDDDDDDDDTATQEGGTTAPPRAKKKKKTGARGKGGGRAKSQKGSGPLGPGGMSYEAAIANKNRDVTIGKQDAPDLTDAQLAGPMRNATFLSACGVPDSTHVTVKVAIRNGRAVGVSVYSTPKSPESDGCVDRRVRGLYWPSSAKMDSFVTTY